jgi:hypothetical protein
VTIRTEKLAAAARPGPTVKSNNNVPRNAYWATAPNAFDADLVIYRLEEAGATLLALPSSGWTTRLRMTAIDIVRTALESYGWGEARIRPPVPSSDKIDRMDEAMCWLGLIPQDNYVLRRVVGARSLVHPITDRHLFTWRRLGTALGADHKAVQRWHAQGIDMIVSALNRADAARRGGVR